MKRSSILLLSFVIIAASCVKDRIQPANAPVVTPAKDTLMYYWNFNSSDSSKHKADFGVTTGGTFAYNASYVDFTTGTTLNSIDNNAGQCLRVRNPSTSLIFSMPTTGYDSISFSFAEQRSSSGSSQNAIYYTTDGVNYVTTALSNNTYTVDTVFGVQKFSFAADSKVSDNPKFAVKIIFANNNTGTSGNDRFDNVVLHGVRK